MNKTRARSRKIGRFESFPKHDTLSFVSSQHYLFHGRVPFFLLSPMSRSTSTEIGTKRVPAVLGFALSFSFFLIFFLFLRGAYCCRTRGTRNGNPSPPDFVASRNGKQKPASLMADTVDVAAGAMRPARGNPILRYVGDGSCHRLVHVSVAWLYHQPVGGLMKSTGVKSCRRGRNVTVLRRASHSQSEPESKGKKKEK